MHILLEIVHLFDKLNMLYVQDPDEEIGRKEYFGSTQVYPGLLFLELDFGRQKELTLKRISIDSFEIQNVH